MAPRSTTIAASPPARSLTPRRPTISDRPPAGGPYAAFGAISLDTNDQPDERDFARFLASTATTSFLVIKDGRLLYERYFNGYTRDSTVTSFSIAKSVLSALVGIAIHDGAIKGVDAPITDYLPELAQRDARFRRITIRDLLTMSSGLAWHKVWNPLDDDAAKTYYDPNLRALALHAAIAEPPGRHFQYNPYNALLVGLILERATHQSVSYYLQEKLWKPLGMEASGSWSLDSARDGFEKSESGLNGRAIDFAKLGQLYLDRGRWRGRQLIPSSWVAASTRVDTRTDPAWYYQYFWWVSSVDGVHDHYYAAGNKGEYIYVVPEQRLVMVRFGREYGYDRWPAVFEEVATRIAQVDAHRGTTRAELVAPNPALGATGE